MPDKTEKPRVARGLSDPRNLPGNECCSPIPGGCEAAEKLPTENQHEPTEAAEGKKPIASP